MTRNVFDRLADGWLDLMSLALLCCIAATLYGWPKHDRFW